MSTSPGLNPRLAVCALGALAIGTVAFSASAAAAPLPLFPFFMVPQTEAAPPVQAAPSQDEGTVVEMPARLKRQVVNYATREAPGTIIIDTPNTYLYYVLGNAHAIRSAIALPPQAFPSSSTHTIT